MLVGPDGKPVAAHDITVVQIFIAHKKVGMPGTAKYPILVAEVDGDLKTVRSVLQAAMRQTLTKLNQLGAIKKEVMK